MLLSVHISDSNFCINTWHRQLPHEASQNLNFDPLEVPEPYIKPFPSAMGFTLEILRGVSGSRRCVLDCAWSGPVCPVCAVCAIRPLHRLRFSCRPPSAPEDLSPSSTLPPGLTHSKHTQGFDLYTWNLRMAIIISSKCEVGAELPRVLFWVFKKY